MVMEPKYLAFWRWFYTPIIIWRSEIGSIALVYLILSPLASPWKPLNRKTGLWTLMTSPVKLRAPNSWKRKQLPSSCPPVANDQMPGIDSPCIRLEVRCFILKYIQYITPRTFNSSPLKIGRLPLGPRHQSLKELKIPWRCLMVSVQRMTWTIW